MIPTKLYSDSSSEIWLADSLDTDHVTEVMNGRIANALIFDAPFSETTHSGHKDGKLTADRAAAFAKAHADSPTPESKYSARKSEHGESGRRDIDYDCFTEEDIEKFSEVWMPVCSGWTVSITDDVLAPVWRKSFEKHGRYAFSPVALVETGSRVRMSGDGPSQWSTWAIMSRPKNKEYSKWGALPGAYVQPAERHINSRNGTDRIVGGKNLKTMIEIVSDYSRQGDLVIDPCCGAVTTGRACLRLGRKFIGIEIDPGRAKLSAEIINAESRFTTRAYENAGQQGLFKEILVQG